MTLMLATLLLATALTTPIASFRDDPPAPSKPQSADIVSALESAMADAIAAAEPSVVAILRYRNPRDPDETKAIRGQLPPLPPRPRTSPELRRFMPDDFPDPSADDQPIDFGSGVVIGAKGEILTAFHVVRGATKIEVRAWGSQQFEAEIIAADSHIDLAVIAPRQSTDGSIPKLKPMAIGDADKLRKGSFLIALGNPFDAAKDGEPSASWGILANKARKMAPPADRLTQSPLRHLPSLLQLDSKLNLGMSGGAVVNLKGELVGLTTAAANPASFDAQAGYAIPMDALGRRAVQTLNQGEEMEYGFLGIRLDPGGSSRIDSVEPGTPAFLGDIRTGDVILSVGGISIRNSEELRYAINKMPVGERITFRIERDGKATDRTATLSKLKIDNIVIVTKKPPEWRGVRVDYTSAVQIVGDIEFLRKMGSGGVSVAEVEPNSPGDAAGLRARQIIYQIGGKNIATPKEFHAAAAGLRGPVTLKTDDGDVVVAPPRGN